MLRSTRALQANGRGGVRQTTAPMLQSVARRGLGFGAIVAAVEHLLDAVVTFPGAVYSALLGVVLLYWMSMLAGAVDLDLLGGAEHGGADGAVDAAGHGGHGGHADAVGDGDAGDGDGGVLASLGALGLRRLPMTVSVSLLVIWGWLVSVLGTVMFADAAARHVPSWAFRAALFAVALVSSLKLASVSARPIAPLFVANKASRREHLVGKLAEVSTGRLDAGFGQVLVGDGGAGLLIDARHEGGAALKRGDRVVVTSWDADRGIVTVEPIDAVTALRVEAAVPDAAEPESPKSGDAAAKRMVR